MTSIETLEKYPLFDLVVLQHGFAPYLRDYELLTEADWIGDTAARLPSGSLAYSVASSAAALRLAGKVQSVMCSFSAHLAIQSELG